MFHSVVRAKALVVAVCAIFLLTALPLIAAAEQCAKSPDEIREALSGVYIHGITKRIAKDKIGFGCTDELAAVLLDKGSERPDNAMGFLKEVGNQKSVAHVREYLRTVEAPDGNPNRFRAFLNGSRVVGAVYRRTRDLKAKELLQSMLRRGGNGGVLAKASAKCRRPEYCLASAITDALWGSVEAGATRRELRRKKRVNPAPSIMSIAPVVTQLEGIYCTFANKKRTKYCTDQVKKTRRRASGRLLDNGKRISGSSSSATMTRAMDTSGTAHDTDLDYANHPDTTSPVGDAFVDDLLHEGSVILGRADFGADVSCCVRFTRLGSGSTFGSSSDGLDIIDTNAELNAVLDDNAGRVKVVNSIRYCGSPGNNIIGCAWVGGDGMALVRFSSLFNEAKLWIHEYGHNVGLGHNNNNKYIMHGTLYTGSAYVVGATQTECNTFHSPSSGANATVNNDGACADSDGDQVQDGIDNCPGIANFDQADGDGDGLGDACESGCGNGAIDGVEECDGNDLGGSSCQSEDFTTGTLGCNNDCTFNTSQCESCGNGILEGNEECDSADLNGASCEYISCGGGTPTCTGSCEIDYGTCTDCPVCDNDGVCETGEDCDGCLNDCFAGSGAVCGNNVCDVDNGEDCVSCPADCNGKQNGKPENRYCCGDGDGQNPVGCGDSRCAASGNTCSNNLSDPSCCGDLTCEGIENGNNCSVDCGAPPFCGDEICNNGEDKCSCAADCGNPDSFETSCIDLNDNDCDGDIDCDDVGDCGSFPGCQCSSSGSSCSTNSDCCSNKCKGPRSNKTCR